MIYITYSHNAKIWTIKVAAFVNASLTVLRSRCSIKLQPPEKEYHHPLRRQYKNFATIFGNLYPRLAKIPEPSEKILALPLIP